MIVACRAGDEEHSSTRSPAWAPRSTRWGRTSRSAAAEASGSRPRGGRSMARCSPSTATSCSTSISARCSPSTRRAARRGRSSSRRSAPRSASSRSRTTATVTGFREAPLLEHWVNSGVYVLGEEALALLPEKGDHEQSTFPQLAGERKAARAPPRGRLAHGEHAEGSPAAPPSSSRRIPSGGRRGSSPDARLAELRLPRPLRVRAAPGREAVGLGADLGARRRLRREGPVRAGGRVALAPVPPGEGRELVRPERTRAARARRGRPGSARRGGRHGRARASTSGRARCIESPRSRTRRSSRSRRRSSTISSGSRTATDAKAPATPERILRWDGCVNVRDLGGLPLAGGGETAYRVVVRADWLPGLSDAGRQALVDYGVSLVVDLRPDREHEDDGINPLPVPVVRQAMDPRPSPPPGTGPRCGRPTSPSPITTGASWRRR